MLLCIHFLACSSHTFCSGCTANNATLPELSNSARYCTHLVTSTSQVLTDAPAMDTALPISPLDPRQGRIKQENLQELHASHSAADIDYQVSLGTGLPSILS